jgi:hypothetical protein
VAVNVFGVQVPLTREGVSAGPVVAMLAVISLVAVVAVIAAAYVMYLRDRR